MAMMNGPKTIAAQSGCCKMKKWGAGSARKGGENQGKSAGGVSLTTAHPYKSGQ